jgi:hypothetical protein
MRQSRKEKRISKNARNKGNNFWSAKAIATLRSIGQIGYKKNKKLELI